MEGLTVASDKASRLQMPATKRSGGSVTLRPRLVPERYGHAVPLHSDRTLCGLSLSGLYRFEGMPFARLGHHLRCLACDILAEHPHVARRRIR